jgi:hypothetical protein
MEVPTSKTKEWLTIIKYLVLRLVPKCGGKLFVQGDRFLRCEFFKMDGGFCPHEVGQNATQDWERGYHVEEVNEFWYREDDRG